MTNNSMEGRCGNANVMNNSTYCNAVTLIV